MAADPPPTAAPATADGLFVDANVLVFSLLPKSPNHACAVAALAAAERGGLELWVSPQVVRELLVQLTRTGPRSSGEPVKPAVAAQYVAAILPRFRLADVNAAVAAELLSLLRTVGARGKNVHDANVVATMLVHGVGRLLPHNVKDFQCYAMEA